MPVETYSPFPVSRNRRDPVQALRGVLWPARSVWRSDPLAAAVEPLRECRCAAREIRQAHGVPCAFNHNMAKTAMIWLNASNCHDMVEKLQASLSQYFNGLARPPGTGGIVSTPSSPKSGRDSLPRYALSGGLTATLWVKPLPDAVAGSKERRRGAARICLKSSARIWLKSHSWARVSWLTRMPSTVI